jgi:hypothetical protein
MTSNRPQTLRPDQARCLGLSGNDRFWREADIRRSGEVRKVPNSEVAASFDQAPSTRNVGGISGVSAHASRARTSRVHSGALLNMPTLPRVGTAFLTRRIIFFRPQLRNSIWDRSVKLSGFYRSGARHISATDLTQYLLADLIVRVENTGFSYASPGPLGSRLNRLAFPAWNSSLRGRR